MARGSRAAVHEKFMADMRMKPDVDPMPFDGRRPIYGGFEMIVDM